MTENGLIEDVTAKVGVVRSALVGAIGGVLVVAVLAVAAVLAPAAASAAINVTAFDASFDDPTGDPVRQAGAHPNVSVSFRVETTDPDNPLNTDVIEQIHRTFVKLPPGLVGDATQIPTCPDDRMKAGANNNAAICPTNSQVGYALISQGSIYIGAPIYNLGASGHYPAVFGFTFLGAVVRLVPTVRAGDYGITMDSGTISQGAKIAGANVVLWGVPQDPANDARRVAPGGQISCLNLTTCFGGGAVNTGPPTPLLSLPTSCAVDPLRFDLLVDGWRSKDAFTERSITADEDDVPFTLTGCDRLPFDAGVDVKATSRLADSPSGLDVELAVTQNRVPDGLAAAHVKDVEVVLPDGLTVSPSSAVGLGACSSAQIDLASDGPHSCPRSSKLGTVSVESPLIDTPLSGEVILATPDDNPFGSLIALYIVAEGSGVRLKIPGRVDPDPVTGRLTATFENNPQLPFSNLRVRFDGGENASLATPSACGAYQAQTAVDSWSGKSVDLTSPIAIDQGCDKRGFAPSFAGGSVSPIAGGESAFAVEIARPDRTQELSTLDSLKLPEGLLGHVSKVDVCTDAAADAGSCGEGSRIGHVQIAAGPGGSPVWVPERGKAPTSVSLAGPYKGAPYSLSVVVPAQAGPFDLGRVVARSPLHIDRRTAQLSTGIDVSRVFDRRGNLTQTIAGGMPTIVEGIPLRLRELRVVVDRDGFTVNPTSCEPTSVDATLKSTTGQTREVGSRFQVGECASLGFSPRLGMRLLGKRQTTTGRHPALRTVLTQPGGQANIGLARVVMPRSVVLDPNNSVDPQLVCDYDVGQRGDCDANSVIGRARAVSPLLKRPLRGTVHLVQGIRFGPSGNRIRTTPSLLVKLRGEVDIDLHGRTTVHAGRLVTVFKQVPDARVSRFALRINGGKKGILVVTGSRRGNIDICDSRQTANLRFVGHNGKRTSQRQIVRTPCRKAGKANAGKRNANAGKQVGSKRTR